MAGVRLKERLEGEQVRRGPFASPLPQTQTKPLTGQKSLLLFLAPSRAFRLYPFPGSGVWQRMYLKWASRNLFASKRAERLSISSWFYCHGDL